MATDVEIRRVLAPEITGLPEFCNEFLKRVYAERHEGAELKIGKIREIVVQGFASPEGNAQDGPYTLEPGFIDQANLRLADVRADAAAEVVKEQLMNMGADIQRTKVKLNLPQFFEG